MPPWPWVKAAAAWHFSSRALWPWPDEQPTVCKELKSTSSQRCAKNSRAGGKRQEKPGRRTPLCTLWSHKSFVLESSKPLTALSFVLPPVLWGTQAASVIIVIFMNGRRQGMEVKERFQSHIKSQTRRMAPAPPRRLLPCLVTVFTALGLYYAFPQSRCLKRPLSTHALFVKLKKSADWESKTTPGSWHVSNSQSFLQCYWYSSSSIKFIIRLTELTVWRLVPILHLRASFNPRCSVAGSDSKIYMLGWTPHSTAEHLRRDES